MSFKSIISEILFWGTAFIIVPIILPSVNNELGLPQFDNIMLDIFGIVIVFIAFYVLIYCWFIFVKFGGGTPSPFDPPKKFTSNGLYKYSRNPMYIGYFAILFGEFLVTGALLQLIYAAIFVVIFQFIVIKVEEPHLKNKFGKEFESYSNTVKRWI